MKRLNYHRILILILMSLNSYAQKYYTTSTGTWENDPLWDTSTAGTGMDWSLTSLMDGDTIKIDDDLILESDLTIDVDAYIIIDANFTLRGQLRLTTASVIEFTENGRIGSDEGGNSSKIRFGNDFVWEPNDGGETGPGTMDKDYNGTLPVSLLSFNASNSNDKILLVWQTASEENNDFFTIERSRDGIHYKSFAAITGAGSSHALLQYSYFDPQPHFGRSYYRLSQTDYDGITVALSIVTVDYTTVKKLSIFPNPLTSGQALTIQTGANPEEKVNVMIYNHSGILVRNEQIQSNNEMSTGEFEAGFYILKIASGQTSKSTRLMID